MNQVTAHNKRYTTNEGDLYCDFELGKKNWELGQLDIIETRGWACRESCST